MNKPKIFTLLGLSAMFAISADAENLLSNPSFELGSEAVTFSPSTEFGGAAAFDLGFSSTAITGWIWQRSEITFGEAFWLEDNLDLFGSDGDHLLYLDSNQSIQWVDTGAEVSAGETLTFDYNFATWERSQDLAPGDPSSGEGTILLEYSYRDLADDLKFGVFPTDLRPPENGDSGPAGLIWASGSESLVVPADFGSNFNFYVTTSGTGMLVDNLALNNASVPEPGTLGLLGMAAGLLFLRRSRRG